MHPHFYRWENWGSERLNHLLAQDYNSLPTQEFQSIQVQAFNDCAMLTISWEQEQEHCIFSFLELSIVSGNLSLDTLLNEYNMYSTSLHATCCPDFLYSQVISVFHQKRRTYACFGKTLFLRFPFILSISSTLLSLCSEVWHIN